MKCHNREFMILNPDRKTEPRKEHAAFPDTLIDYLSGAVIPFSNRDNIRQTLVKTLIEEKGYQKTDISLDREIRFELDGQQIRSAVDIAVCFGSKTLMVWKCASGSVVSRERQVIATARLLEEYIVPFAVVTNGVDLELLDTISEKVVGEGISALPTREELADKTENLIPMPANRKKRVNEQRILSTYDALSCAIHSKNDPAY